MKVRHSPRSISDLARIADYLTTRSPQGALSVDRSIRRTIDLIAAFPGSRHRLEQRPAIRVMPTGRHPYLVFYTERDGGIVILHVRHGARAPADPGAL